jgi:hypothetical protein
VGVEMTFGLPDQRIVSPNNESRAIEGGSSDPGPQEPCLER